MFPKLMSLAGNTIINDICETGSQREPPCCWSQVSVCFNTFVWLSLIWTPVSPPSTRWPHISSFWCEYWGASQQCSGPAWIISKLARMTGLFEAKPVFFLGIVSLRDFLVKRQSRFLWLTNIGNSFQSCLWAIDYQGGGLSSEEPRENFKSEFAKELDYRLTGHQFSKQDLEKLRFENRDLQRKIDNCRQNKNKFDTLEHEIKLLRKVQFWFNEYIWRI